MNPCPSHSIWLDSFNLILASISISKTPSDLGKGENPHLGNTGPVCYVQPAPDIPKWSVMSQNIADLNNNDGETGPQPQSLADKSERIQITTLSCFREAPADMGWSFMTLV